MISEERLRELVVRILKELETEAKVYMLCTHEWDERFYTCLKQMEQIPGSAVYPVIPLSFQKKGYEERLRSCSSCRGIIYRSDCCEYPKDLDLAVTVMPVVPRDLLVKTALCISDTFETSWIAACMEQGGRIDFLRSGLARFSGKEPETYVNQILAYYRQVLGYGIRICEIGEKAPVEVGTTSPVSAVNYVKGKSAPDTTGIPGKKRVITASNVSQFAVNGILNTCEGDIITDLAKDRAKFLNIQIR